ncbi:MAG: hypothetical protein IJ785_05595 [Bacteroidales bacterium]|nr:hypothetical protein [Bacteroidales bacterium]
MHASGVNSIDKNKPKITFTDWMVRFWWVLPLVTVLAIVATVLVFEASTVWGFVLSGLSALVLLLQLPVFITLLLKKEWWRAIGAFLAGIVCLVLETTIPLLFFSMFAAGLFSLVPDNFGKEHPIPEGLEYNTPITDTNHRWNATDGDIFTPVAIDSTDTASWLQLWNGDQGGIYNFAFYWPELEDGEVYLRCFEATENIELSKDRLKPRTATEVSNHNGFGQIVMPNHKDFTIYEGDWEDYYAVRVEVWHKPTKGKAHKLMEKVYRMEGWMR